MAMPKLWANSLDEHRALVRARLVEAYVALAAERGVDEVTVAAVAERADLARSAVYNHVDHLHDLALWHAERVMGEWLDSLRADAADSPGAWQRVEDIVRRSLAVFASDPIAGMDLVQHLDEERAARLYALLAPIMEHLRHVVAEGVRSGELVDEDPADMLSFIWATLSGYRTMVGSGRLPADAAADTAVRLLERAVRAGP